MRALAELEHTPWAAEDGAVWVAAFGVSVDLDEAAEVQLSVAPDITVALRRAGTRLARPGDLVTAGESARTPVAKADAEPRPRRPRERLGAADRLTARLANTIQALELERERRATAEQALEDQRTTTRRLQTELGRARAELELAHAAQAEAAAGEAELEAARRELQEAQRRHEELNRVRERELEEAQRRHDELTRERDQTTQAHDAARTALHERAGALESAREALARERAEAGRLRSRLEHAEKSPASPLPGGHRTDDDADPGAARTPPWSTPRPVADAPPRLAPAARVRPLNPSLRHRTYWLGRLLALLVLAIVIAAIWIVLHSTILH
jgi:hypothetical protein